MENKKMPLQLMALTKQDDGFLVSLQLCGSETGFSLRQISSGQLQAGFQVGKGNLESATGLRSDDVKPCTFPADASGGSYRRRFLAGWLE